MSVAGGAAGAALFLLTPAEAFDLVVPWLVGLGSVLLLSRDRMRAWVDARATRKPPRAGARRTLAWGLVVFALGIYAGYFGAGVGVLALAALALERTEALAVTNAVKNVVTGVANGNAAIAYILFAPVHWPSAIALGLGAVLGGLLGPMIVRAAPEGLFRWLIGLAGLVLALWLGVR